MMKPSSTSCFRTRAKDLLGDLQNVQKLGDFQAGIAVHEMQHAMMGAAEAILLKNGIGIAGEIAIGEEEKFDAGDEVKLRAVAHLGGRTATSGNPGAPDRRPDAVSDVMSVMLTYWP